MILYELVLRRLEKVSNCNEWLDVYSAIFSNKRNLRYAYLMYKDYYNKHKYDSDLCLLFNKLDSEEGFLESLDEYQFMQELVSN